ncbi:MAG TPA: DUF6677 family protein [Verrucomicrobiae bacterium]|jgi:hypothetical protein|nr:DUF6677 family protein [Verrucomicrobiae bacterium]
MANTATTTDDAKPKAPAAPLSAMAIMAPALGWLVPGAGHLVQKRWIRGLLLMVSILSMFSIGVAMEGKIYLPNTGDLLDILGFVGDIGNGGLYFLGRAMEWGGQAITSATSGYGTIYIVGAGLLNIITMVDAYHIARGRKA